ncbi:DUF4249 domain-containing protein [Leeuwenhoekiella marinoflava]|uniref:DUF4249 domain-containing protein n=1 Tax=Leeuwenhoekiella marinoflava TaxID=988 RepID=UPI003001133D
MKTLYILVSAAFVSLLVASCEEVIELDLDTQDSQLVIEGIVSDRPGPYQVLISKTVDFYDDNTFPVEENATVRLSSDQGESEVLVQTSPGVYESTQMQGQRGVNYTLDVDVAGTSYSASSRLPKEQIVIDSISVGYKKESLFQEEGYYAIAYFDDPPDAENYYRLQVLVNGEPYIFYDEDEETPEDGTEDDNLYLLSDKFTNGNVQDYEFPQQLEPGDTINVRLQQLDRNTYDYYRTLVNVLSGGGIAPANPITNWTPEALGYFGAISETKSTVVVPEEE